MFVAEFAGLERVHTRKVRGHLRAHAAIVAFVKREREGGRVAVPLGDAHIVAPRGGKARADAGIRIHSGRR